MLTPDAWSTLFAADESLAGVLLTLVQVNGTILAFVLGIRIVAMQLSSRFDLRRVRLGLGDLIFIGFYAAANVVFPLIASVYPSLAYVWLSIGLSIVLGIAVPIVMRRTVAAGLPRGIIRATVRRASRALTVRSRLNGLNEAATALPSLRDAAASDSLREDVQLGLLALLEIALKRGDPANHLVIAVLGDIDGHEVERVTEFMKWLRAGNSGLLFGQTQTATAAFNRLSMFALGGSTMPQARALLTSAAADFATAGVSEDYRGAKYQSLGRTKSFFCMNSGPENGWVQRSSDLAVQTLEVSPLTLNGRPQFDAICELITTPFTEIRLGRHVSIYAQIKALRQLFGALTRVPSDPEIDYRIGKLCEVVLQMMEHLEDQHMLASDEARDLFTLYLDWVDAAAADDRLLVDDLRQELRYRFSRGFVRREKSGHKAAASSAFASLLEMLVNRFADTVITLEASYRRRWGEDSSGFAHPGIELFDPVHWDHYRVSYEIAQTFYPGVERRHLEPNGQFTTALREPIEFPMLRYDKRHDILGGAFVHSDRPDMLLGILRSRWSRALDEDFLRPGARRRRDKAFYDDVVAPATGEQGEALRKLFERERNEFAPPFDAVAKFLVARDLLRRAVDCRPYGDGIGARTYEGWRQAAESWLAATEEDEDAAVDLVSNIPALPQDNASLARYIEFPLEKRHTNITNARTMGIWQAIYGHTTPNETLFRRSAEENQMRGATERIYWAIPLDREWDEIALIVEEEDRSRWLVPLIVDETDVQMNIPVSSRYLGRVLLEECLGGLLVCSTCFNTGDRQHGRRPKCPICDGSGHVPQYGLLLRETCRFYVKQFRSAGSNQQPVPINEAALRDAFLTALRDPANEPVSDS